MSRDPSDRDYYEFVRNTRLPRWAFDERVRANRWANVVIAVLAIVVLFFLAGQWQG